MADDPVSYEQAVEEEASKDDADPEPEKEISTGLQVKTVEDIWGDPDTIAQAVPDFLKPDAESRRIERPDVGGRRGGLGVDIDVSDLDGLSDAGLLEVIARVNIAQLAALFDIADAVEPFQNITVSGINAIDDADTAEPVVPESDEEQIPTRTLMVRADRENKAKIYFGDDEVSPDSGFALEAGEYIWIETDLRAEELYMASVNEGETVQLLGLV